MLLPAVIEKIRWHLNGASSSASCFNRFTTSVCCRLCVALRLVLSLPLAMPSTFALAFFCMFGRMRSRGSWRLGFARFGLARIASSGRVFLLPHAQRVRLLRALSLLLFLWPVFCSHSFGIVTALFLILSVLVALPLRRLLRNARPLQPQSEFGFLFSIPLLFRLQSVSTVSGRKMRPREW